MNKARLMKIRAMVDAMSLEEKARICSGADYWNTEAFPRHGIPSIRMADGPNGLGRKTADGGGNRSESLPATCFPSAAALACSFDRALLREVGSAIAAEAVARDVSLLLGPAINIKRSPLSGRNFEYYSEDPVLAGELGAAFVEGVQALGVGACVKHFAANNRERGRFVSNSCVDPRALDEIYLEGFRRVTERAKPYAVMTSYNRLNNVYTGEDTALLTGTLREKWGFDGMVVSDWGAVNDRVASLAAGLDLEMPGKTSDTAADITAAIRSRRLKKELLDDAVTRILGVVSECGRRSVGAEVDYDLQDKIARRAAAESIVLMKNEGGLLPFDDGRPFAVIGHFAKAARIQGGGSARVNPAKLSSLTGELDERQIGYLYAEGCNADGSTNDLLVGEAKRAAVGAGRAVIFAGLPDGAESEGFDREDMRLPDGMLKLIDQVSSVCGEVAVVLMLGAPVELPFISRVKSVLCCYLGGQAAGAAAADVITGRVNPGGKLAESWAKRLSDLPADLGRPGRKNVLYREGIYVGYRYYDAAGEEPQFSFGHGLSYTAFEYGRLQPEQTEISERGRVAFSVMLRNTGGRSGGEAVQVYVGKKGEGYKQLKAFQKVFLFPGECRELPFTLSWQDFTYYNTESRRRELESGVFEVMIGGGSRDIRLSFDVAVRSRRDRPVPPYFGPKGDDGLFSELLGYTPEEPDSRPLTLNSTLFELSHSLEGKLIVRHMKAAMQGTLRQEDALRRRMMEEGIDDIPLRAISALSGGRLPKNTAVAMVHFCNHKHLRGVLRLIRKRRS